MDPTARRPGKPIVLRANSEGGTPLQAQEMLRWMPGSDGDVLCAAYEGGLVVVWDLLSQSVLYRLPCIDAITAIAWQHQPYLRIHNGGGGDAAAPPLLVTMMLGRKCVVWSEGRVVSAFDLRCDDENAPGYIAWCPPDPSLPAYGNYLAASAGGNETPLIFDATPVVKEASRRFMTGVKQQQQQVVKGLAFLLQALAVLLMLVFRTTDPASWLNGVPGIKNCGNPGASGLTVAELEDIEQCYRDQLGYRFGTGAVIVFLIQCIFSLLGSTVGMAVTGSWWILKFLMVPGLGFLLILVPNTFFNTLIDVYTGILFIFIVLQLVVLLDFGYSWNDLWVSNAIEDQRGDMLNEKAGKKWYIALTSISVIMYLWFIAAFIWMFTLTGGSSTLNAVLSVTFVITILLVIFSWTEWAKAGALLPSAVVALYVTWLAYCSSLSNYAYQASPNAARQVIGYIVAAVVFIYMSTRVANPVLVRQDDTNIDDVAVATVQQEKRDSQNAARTAGKAGGDDDAVAKLANIDVGAAPVDGTAGQPDLEGGGQTQQTTTNVAEDSTSVSWWHVLFLNIVHLTGAMYLTVLSTKWISNPLTPADGRTASRQLDYWIQVTAMWTMLALFAWTLVAPVLFKNRNFSGTCVVVGMGRPRIRQGSGDIVHGNRPLMGVCYSSNNKKQRQQSWWSRCVKVVSKRGRRQARADGVQSARYHQYDRMAEERMVVVGESTGRRQSVSRVKEVGAKAASPQLRESSHTKAKRPNNSGQSKRASNKERGGGSPKASRRSHPSPARGRRGKPRRGERTAAVVEQGAVKIPWACCCSVITGPEWSADGGDESLSTFILCADRECQWRPVDEAGMSCQRRIAKLLLKNALPHFHQNEDQTTAATTGPPRRSRSQMDVRVLPPPREDQPRADRQCCSLLSASPEGSGEVLETFILCDDEKCQSSGECGSVQHRVARALAAAAVEDRGKELARLLSVREDIEAQLVRAGKRLKVQGSVNGTDKPLG
ncbi:Serine incorporator 3, partial [Perkinsus olseni]